MVGKRSTKQTGKIGENLAVEFLVNNGYAMVERNHINKLGEIDIIARDGKALCFIEVKTRYNDNLGRPEEAVGKSKQRKLSQVALSYIKLRGIDKVDCRFDVVAVMVDRGNGEPDVRLFKNAFDLDRQYFF